MGGRTLMGLAMSVLVVALTIAVITRVRPLAQLAGLPPAA